MLSDCQRMTVWKKKCPKSSIDMSKVTAICLCAQILRFRRTCCKVTRQILFCSESASYHSSHLKPFCMATPRQAPCGGSARKDRRSVLLIWWQDAGTVSHWVDPLSLCSLLSPGVHWPLVLTEDHGFVRGCCPFSRRGKEHTIFVLIVSD